MSQPAPVAAVLEKVDDLGPPGTPVTTREVADGFDCTQRTVYNRLDSLVADGVLQTKKVGAKSRVWWRPVGIETRRGGTRWHRERVRSHPVFDSEMVGIIVWGLDSTTDDETDLVIRDANDAFLEMAGFEYEEALDVTWRDLTPEEFYADFEQHIEEVNATGSGVAYDKQYYRADGSRWWGLFESRKVDDSTYVEFVIDITERKRRTRALEERTAELEEARTRLKVAAEAGSVGLYTVNVDEDRLIADSYAAYCYGVDPDRAAEGAPADDFVAAVHEDDTERVLREFESALTETGRLETEYRVRNGDGDLVWLVSRGTVEYDDAGNPRKLHGAISDITEQKRREAREQFLLELGDRIRTLDTEDEIGATCTRLLAEELGLDRAYFVRFDPDEGEALVGPEYHGDGLDPVSGLYPFSAFPEAIRKIQTDTLVFDDTANAETLPVAERRALLELDFGAWIGAPIRADEEHADWALYAVTSDPHDWTDADVTLVEDAAERTWTAVERARAEGILKRSNRSLERLNNVSHELIDADPEMIKERVAELTVDVLDVEYAALWRYDGRTGDLERHTEHAAAGTDLDAIRPSEVSREDVWDAFVDDDVLVENALDIADGDSPSRLGSRIFVPLGRHGVIIAGSVHARTFEERLLDLVTMVAQTAETLWDRAESERELELRNEELTRLDRLNTLIRAIGQVLVGSDAREEIDEAVCDRLADSALYEFAWIGEYDAETDKTVPQAWAGIDSHPLETLSDSIDSSSSDQNPFTTAVRTGEMQVIADIATDSQARRWREEALKHGARSCVAIPLTHDDSNFGVLTVYGRTPRPDRRETEVLAELGQTIAHTIRTTEATTTRQAAAVVELTLRFPDASTPLCRLSRRAECEIAFEGLVSRSDGEPDVFLTVPGTPLEAVRAAVEELLVFEEVRPIVERGDETLFKARVVEPTLASQLVAGGAVVRSLTIDAGVATTVVTLSDSAEVSRFLDDLRSSHPRLELLARKTREQPLTTGEIFSTAIDARLTDRQREVLQTAYRSGFFESPRVNSAQDVTALLDISQPTFSYHLREAERRLCELFFDGSSSVEFENTETHL